jgi:MYXO-CTERM domain-containing protein
MTCWTPPKAALMFLTASLAAMGCMDAPLLEGEVELGRQSSAIINGSLDQGHPAVGILHSGSTGCTATLIGQRTLLTAAHCVTNATSPDELLSPVEFLLDDGTGLTADEVIVHPEYQGGNKSDLAVIRLSQPLVNIKAVLLSHQALAVGDVVELIGFGKTGETTGQFGVKRQAMNTIGKITSQIYSMYGAEHGNGNLCNGDSGGPTFITENGQEILVGIHSTKGGACGQEGHDMRVDAFSAWIKDAAAGDVTFGTFQTRNTEPPATRLDETIPSYEPNSAGGNGQNLSFGEACITHADCQSGLCAQDTNSGESFCTQTCSPDQEGCPSDSLCQPAGKIHICATLENSLPDNNNNEGQAAMGCSVAQTTGNNAWPWALLLVLAICRRRRSLACSSR